MRLTRYIKSNKMKEETDMNENEKKKRYTLYDIVYETAQRTNCPFEGYDAYRFVREVFETIKLHLLSGDVVAVSKFASFNPVKHKPMRVKKDARFPNGEYYIKPAWWQIKFKPFKRFKEQLEDYLGDVDDGEE